MSSILSNYEDAFLRQTGTATLFSAEIFECGQGHTQNKT